MAYFRSVSDNEEEEEDDEYLRDRMDRNYPFRDYSHGINPVLQEANYFPESSGAIKQDVDYFQTYWIKSTHINTYLSGYSWRCA